MTMAAVTNSLQTTNQSTLLTQRKAATDTTSTNTSGVGTTNGTTTTSGQGNTASEIQDRFLKLLVAQMKNQDPLNPLDNAEVTAQTAAISTVEGIEKLNTTMSTFASGSTRATGSTGLIGQSALVPGSTLTWGDTTTVMHSGVTLDGEATRLSVQLLDASGNVVDQRDYTSQSAGTIAIDWSGTDSSGNRYGAGTYTMRATVQSDTGKTTATTLATDTVTGVSDAAGGVVAHLASGSTIAASQIQGVFRP